MSDKKISDLPIASAINATDISVLVSSGTDYQFAFSTLLQFISSGLSVGANITFGITLPQNTTGSNGDVFINISAGSFAQKIAGVWTIAYTLPLSGSATDGTVLYGLGVPANSAGNNNDTYIDTAFGIFYKRSAGVWGQVFSMQTGPAGPTGGNGTNGIDGVNGKTVLNGPTNPSNVSTGTDGDFYINTSTLTFFGPKTGGVWPTGNSLAGADGATGPTGAKGDKGDTGNTGATGATGAAGATGIGVAAGGTTGQVLAKIDGTDYNTGWVNPAVADFPFGTLFYGSSVVWDYSIKRNMNLFLVGNCSIAINNMNDGDVAILTLKQDATGSRTVSIIGKSKVAGSSDGSITLSAAAGKEDSLYIIKKGDTFYIQVYLNYTAAAFVNPTSYLDNYAAGIKAAFSISKLFSTYSGHAIRVRRDSDNTEADFGFVSGGIDVAGINTFVSGANGFISKWYDQSGNGKDAVQATTSSQPKIIMNVLNGLPAIRFDGASSTLLTGSFLDNSFDKSFTSMTLASKTGSGFTLHENNSSYYGSRNNVANNVLYNVGGISGGAAQNVPAYNNNAEQLLLETFTYDGTNRNVYVNNALYGVVNSPLSTDKMNMTGSMYIGSLGGGSFWWDGDIFTKIYMNSALAVSDVHLSNLKIINDFALEQLPYIKFKGNSLVKGYNSSSGDERYPGTSFPSQLVQAFGGPVTFSFVNEGSNGARIEDIDSSQSASDIYSTNGLCSKLIIIFLEGRNSLATGDSAVTAFSALNTYLAKLRAIGYSKIAVLTCEPSEMVPGSPATNNSSGVSTNSFEVQRLLFNTMVLAGAGTNYDYVIDIASDSRVGILSNIGNLTYWSSDKIHYTDAGYLVLAELCADTLNTMLS